MSPVGGGVEAVASWIHQSFMDDFGAEAASRVATIVRQNDISLRVLRSLNVDDFAELFSLLSFGQKRTLKLLIEQTKRDSTASYSPTPQLTANNSSPIQVPPPQLSSLQSLDADLTCAASAPSTLNHSSVPFSRSRSRSEYTANQSPTSSPTNTPVNNVSGTSPPPNNLPPVNQLAKNLSATNLMSTDNSPVQSPKPASDPRLTRDDLISPPRKRRKTTSQNVPASTPSKDEFYVCIVGPSGVGKSTTLNAILDGFQVLPTSSMRASTAVPIEIRYKQCTSIDQHSDDDSDSEELPFESMPDQDITAFLTSQASEDKRFLAEIDFISEDHWKSLVQKAITLLDRKRTHRKKLQSIIASATQNINEDTPNAAMEEHCKAELHVEPDEAAALAAVRAVLGVSNFTTEQEIGILVEKPKIAAILKHLGQSLRFSFDKPGEVSRRIERFLATSTDRRSAAVWPLVRSARIYGPWRLLSGGMVLVDLPGLQDANSARNIVVSGYINRCHAIITAARISRARDNKTTNDLLTGPVRTGIESGRVKFVGFIATHSDDINPEEIIDDLQNSFSKNFREGLLQANPTCYTNEIPSIKEIKQQLSRLNLLRSAPDGAANLEDTSDDDCVTNTQYEIEELSKSLRSKCIVARNGFVTEALQEQFRQEMANISGVPSFKVFCVSSTQYVSIRRDGCAEVSRDFSDVRFTGIPTLSESLWSLSNTTQWVREQGRRDTDAAFGSSKSDEIMDEPQSENVEELRKFLRCVLEKYEKDEDADAEKIRDDMERAQQEAVAAREAVLSGTEKRAQSRSLYLKDIIALNKKVAEVLCNVLKRCQSSSVSVASDRRIRMWLDQASEHTKEAKAKGAMIAILGDSGSGKSSLLNALLGSKGEEVLPVSGVRACTAAPIAIRYCGTGKFRAEIEFLGAEEWHTELRQLVSDLEEVTRTPLKSRMPYFERPRSELGRIAYDKIMSVYGRIASYNSLIEGSNNVEGRLGTTAKVQAFTPKAIRSKLEAFCSSKSDDSSCATGRLGEAGRLWPLVRVAHLKGPFKILSDSGGCVLDLPGLQDSNTARNAVVRSFLGSCSAFIIAAPIKRAVDNQTARDLLGRQFRRQLLLDGRISSVAFAATQTDDIDALEVASELSLHGVSSYSGIPEHEVKDKFAKHATTIATMRKKIKDLAKRKSDLKSRLKQEKKLLDRATKRVLSTNPIDEDDYYDIHETVPQRHRNRVDRLESQLSEIQTTILGMTAGLAKREHVLNNICSLARNEYCRVQVREDFIEGIQEITAEAFTSDKDTQAPPQLPVFTTSSNDFRYLDQRQTDQAKTFYTVEDTGVPRLFQFVQHNMLVSRINVEYERTERLAVLLSSLSQYLLMKDRATLSQQASLSEEVELILSDIGKSVDVLASEAKEKLNRILLEGPMKKTLRLGEIKARESATMNLGKVENSVHWATYRACLRRFGVYVSPTAGSMNVNESLMAPLMETVIPSWREAFGTGVNKILQSFVTDAIKLADVTLAKIAKKVALYGISAAPVEGAGELRLLAKKSFDMAVADARKCMEKEFEDLQRNCWQELPQAAVQTSLHHGYLRANNESGLGCVARLKSHMRTEVRSQRSAMFNKCVDRINTDVGNVVHFVRVMVSSKLKSYFVGLLDDVEVLWDSTCDLPYESCVCLANTLKKLANLGDKIGIASLALKKSIDGVDFDASDSARSVLPVLDDTKELASLPLIDESKLDSILPKKDDSSKGGNVKQETQFCAANTSGVLHGEQAEYDLDESSASGGAPSLYDTDSEYSGCYF